jgi:Uma2 family endonuclease
MSYAEFLAWADEDTHAEWVDGEVIVFMPPKTIHQQVAGFLTSLLTLYAQLFNLGAVLAAPFEMRINSGSSREPDLLFVGTANMQRLTTERLEGPADLVIELISDSSVARDRDDKFYEYQDAGVSEYWIIDPRPGKERVDFYQLTAAGKYQAALPDETGRYFSTALAGFWLRPEWLWQAPLPNALRALADIAPQAMRDIVNAVQE